MLDISRVDIIGSQRLLYFDTNQTSTSIFARLITDYAWTVMRLTSIYQASLLAPEYFDASSDPWGNVKIPMMESLPGFDNADGSWISARGLQNITYSSLSGLMVTGLSRGRQTEFFVDSSYLKVSCGTSRLFEENESSATPEFFDLIEWLGNSTWSGGDDSSFFRRSSPVGDGWNSFFIDTNWNGDQGQIGANLIYVSTFSKSGTIIGFKCSVSTTRVESAIFCDEDTSCYVDRMRHSLLDTRPAHEPPFNMVTTGFAIEAFIAYFPWAAGVRRWGYFSPTDLFIAGSDQPFSESENQNTPKLDLASADQVSRGLTTLVNTVWPLSMALTAVALKKSSNKTTRREENPDGSSIPFSDTGFPAANATAVTRLSKSLYSANHV